MDNTATQGKAERKITQSKSNIFKLPNCPKPKQLTKYVDTPYNTITIQSTGSFNLLNGIQTGPDVFQRTNGIANAKEIKINLNFIQTGYNNPFYGDEIARIIVLWDMQGGTQPNASDVLLDTDATGTTYTNNMSHRNINNKDRFIFLADKRYHLPAYTIDLTSKNPTLTISPHQVVLDEWSPTINIKLKGLSTRYGGDNQYIGSINSGALYLFMIGSHNSATSGWSAGVSARYSYHN